MSYLVLARKFRPQKFSEVSGQEHVTRTLMNAIRHERIAHAHLFSGPRGVGKTSIARIFAKSLNCSEGITVEPCLKCSNCKEIAQGNNLAVLEIDGASHNSVDNVRDLIESFRAMPPPGSRYKVYIIDEVHMLSLAAFNALLKSLEEPPPHTVFVLATTEAHKIPDTVVSRCQRHDFRVLSYRDISNRLSEIARQEKIEIEADALRTIVRLADGSMRDAQSLLERVRSFSEGAISAADASQVLGTVSGRVLFEMSQAIFNSDAAQILALVNQVFSTGVDPGLLLTDFVSHFRELLIAKFGKGSELERIGIGEHESEELLQQVAGVNEADLQDLVQLAREGCDAALRSVYPRYVFEALVVRMSTRQPVKHLAELLNDLEGLMTVPGPERAAPRGVTAKPAVAPSSDTSKLAPTEGEELKWADFVQQISEGGARILAEQLKRVAVTRFQRGVLKGRGPEFSVGYLKQADNRKKLEEALIRFAGEGAWEIELREDASGLQAASESLMAKEAEERRNDTARRQKDVVNHPGVRSLQKLFPGSKIENIRIKE